MGAIRTLVRDFDSRNLGYVNRIILLMTHHFPNTPIFPNNTHHPLQLLFGDNQGRLDIAMVLFQAFV